MPTPFNQLQTIRDGLLAQLVTDASVTTPYGTIDYSLDGESVSREAWRAGTMARLEKIQELMIMYQPFEIRTIAM